MGCRSGDNFFKKVEIERILFYSQQQDKIVNFIN